MAGTNLLGLIKHLSVGEAGYCERVQTKGR
jgi:hypothetical protein